MTTDHLIFNKLKWFNVPDNADKVNANGKNYTAIPKQFELEAGTPCKFFNTSNSLNTEFPKFTEKSIVNCVGLIDDCYVFTGTLISHNEYGATYTYNLSTDDMMGLVNQSYIKKVIWGGKNLLKALIHKVFTAKVVNALC